MAFTCIPLYLVWDIYSHFAEMPLDSTSVERTIDENLELPVEDPDTRFRVSCPSRS